MKKPILYFLLSGAFLVCGAAEPVIYCSFDHGVNADFGGVRGGDVAGSSTGGVAGVLNSRRGSVTDAEQRPGGISGRAFLAGRSADGKNAYSVRYVAGRRNRHVLGCASELERRRQAFSSFLFRFR